MRWTLWLTSVVIATTFADERTVFITIEDNPLITINGNTEEDSNQILTPFWNTTEDSRANSTEGVDDDNDCVDCPTEEFGDEYGDGNSEYTTTNENIGIETITQPTDTPGLDNSSHTSEENGNNNGGDPPLSSINEDGGSIRESDGGSILNEDFIVQTKSGPIQGYTWQDKDNIISYIDIPYGTFGDPFQAATAIEAWEITHSVREHNKRCPQIQNDEFIGDNDCLTLSIFKPIDAENASVLFHIHAENFSTGSGDPCIYGPDYLVASGIILVLPNYRLGPLGFLCMQNESAPGNMALKDLSLALNWIHDNIDAFGGNPSNIAVSGEGRSGALAGLLALSPVSKDLVSKVIAESGSFLSYWALDRDPAATAIELIEKIMELKETESRTEMSFREFDLRTILKAGKGIEFRPCLEIDVDNAFMVEVPYATITNERIETAFLIGSATYAGLHEALLQTEDSITKLNEDFTLLLPNDLNFSTDTLSREMGERVKEQYFGDEAISIDDVQNISLCFTDIGYLGPGIRSARLLVDAGATVYFYEFAFVGQLNRVLESVDHPVEGATRGDIVGYLFTQDGLFPDEDQIVENKMVHMLTQMWTNFLKNGDPSTETIQWNKLEDIDELEEEWLLIDSEPSMQRGLHIDRLPLWTEMYEEYFIDGNHGHDLSPSVYTILILQFIFWFGFCGSVSHVL